jgi:soluble lytic murein transglycosylase-like protein
MSAPADSGRIGVPLTHRQLVAATVLGLLSAAAPARAELVFFASGRSLSVKGHKTDGNSITMALRAGGEVTCDRSLVTRIEPDEVPYPEPEAVKEDAPALPSVPSVPYAEIIEQVAAANGVDAKLVKALIQVESAFQPNAKSPKGAMGLMQLMPRTARQYALADPFDARANIEAGIRHLKSLLDRFPVKLALAAYNAGESAVQRFGGVPPYAETRAYVTRILSLAAN